MPTGFDITELVSLLPNPPLHSNYQDLSLITPWGIAVDKTRKQLWVANYSTNNVTNYDYNGQSLIPEGVPLFVPQGGGLTTANLMRQTLRGLLTPMQLSFQVTMINNMVMNGFGKDNAATLLNFLQNGQNQSIPTGNPNTGVPNLQADLFNLWEDVISWDRTKPVTFATVLFQDALTVVNDLALIPGFGSFVANVNMKQTESDLKKLGVTFKMPIPRQMKFKQNIAPPKNQKKISSVSTQKIRSLSLLPTGIAINYGKGFSYYNTAGNGQTNAPGAAARVIFSVGQGCIYAYNPYFLLERDQMIVDETETDPPFGTPIIADLVIDNQSSGGFYSGLTLAQNRIYVADFFNGFITVFDNNFFQLSGLYSPNLYQFKDGDTTDPIPSDYLQYNIAYLNGLLYVVYAKVKKTVRPLFYNDAVAISGPGNGYISVFDTNGVFIKRLVSRGALNAPWGLTIAPDKFGSFGGQLLVANNGDGRILAYNFDGKLLGAIQDKHDHDVIFEGVRGLSSNDTSVFWTSDPNQKTIQNVIVSQGIVGKIEPSK